MTGEKTIFELLSHVYHALSAPRRCHVIRLLADTEDGSLSVRYLARHIAATEHDLPPERATGEPYRNVYNALSQTHLSTLADAGIIIYDSNRQEIDPGPNFDLAVLLIALNQATYRTMQGDSLPNITDVNTPQSPIE